MTTSESKGRFFYKTNRFESIRVTNRTESIRIANWNALIATNVRRAAYRYGRLLCMAASAKGRPYMLFTSKPTPKLTLDAVAILLGS